MSNETESILVVDDEESVCKFISIVLNKAGYRVRTVFSGEEALKAVEEEKFSCILVDIIMPGMDGIELLEKIKNNHKENPIIMMSAIGTHDRVIKALEKGAVDFIAKPFSIPQIKEVIRDTIEGKNIPIPPDQHVPSITEKVLKQSYINLLTTMTKILEMKDLYTKGHSERVREYSVKVGRELGLKDEELEILDYAAMLHYIGKIAVSDLILLKEGKLSEEEWSIVKNHPVISSEILSSLKLLHAELPAVRHHHERLDGKGYPDGLKGDQIPLYARILAVADAYDAMSSARPYRKALTREEAIAELKKGKGSQFDPNVVDAFLKAINEESS